MKTSDLAFIGIKGTLVALNRATGQQVWATTLKGMGFVNVSLEDGVVLATCCGEAFCLDALTGEPVWHNPLKGYGRGLASIATEKNRGSGIAAAMAEQQQQDEAAAAS